MGRCPEGARRRAALQEAAPACLDLPCPPASFLLSLAVASSHRPPAPLGSALLPLPLPLHPPTPPIRLRTLLRLPAADFTNTFRSLSSVRAAGGEEMDGASGLPAALAAALGPLEEASEGAVRLLPWACRLLAARRLGCWQPATASRGLPCISQGAAHHAAPRTTPSPAPPPPPTRPPQERYAAWRDWLQLYRGALLAQGMPDAERAAMQASCLRVHPAVTACHVFPVARKSVYGAANTCRETAFERASGLGRDCSQPLACCTCLLIFPCRTPPTPPPSLATTGARFPLQSPQAHNAALPRAFSQDAVNPAVIPRNHVMGDIIGDAEQGNYESLHRSEGGGGPKGGGGGHYEMFANKTRRCGCCRCGRPSGASIPSNVYLRRLSGSWGKPGACRPRDVEVRLGRPEAALRASTGSL